MGGRTNAALEAKDAGDRKSRVQAAYDAAKAELDRLASSRPAPELQALLSAARQELASLQPSRSLAELDALLAAARRDPRRYDCAAVNGSLAIACPKLASERARAARRQALEAQIGSLTGEVAGAEKRLQETREAAREALQRASAELARSAPAKLANADAVALATFAQAVGLSLDVERVNRLLTLLAVLVIEMGGGLALAVGMALSEAGRGGQRANDSVQTPKTAHEPPVNASVDAVDACAQLSRQARPGVQTAGLERDIAFWLRAKGGRARTSMRRLASELGRSHAGVHIEVGRLVAAGVLTALPSARGTVLTLAGRLN
jgi:hypothetical protein